MLVLRIVIRVVNESVTLVIGLVATSDRVPRPKLMHKKRCEGAGASKMRPICLQWHDSGPDPAVR
ncbi:hypothetical protein AQZ50_17880 [Novosphingobium sp. Fuku2-ISO-50]|nr:hypothetical protein AQZ50_17880 [Novosphingobium sp. Fuku2-ISO-50]